MDTNNRYFDLAGMKIAFVDPPSIINYVVGKAFSLSETGPCEPDITINGVIHKDEAFFDNMPAEIQTEYENFDERQEPCFFEGKDGKFFIIVKNMGCASYAVSSPPFTHVDVCCQSLEAETTPLHLQVVLIPTISHLMLLQGKFLMHAGCVSTPEGEGLVLMADSGGGKTGLAFDFYHENAGDGIEENVDCHVSKQDTTEQLARFI